MRWLKLTILILGSAGLGERSANAQFFGPPTWGYGPSYYGGFGSFGRGIGFNISFRSSFGGYGYGPYLPPYPLYRPPIYYYDPAPLVVVRQPPIIVIDRPPTFQLREVEPQPDPGPIPPIQAEVKPANFLTIRPDKAALPAPRAVPDDAELKQAEDELEAARLRLNAILRAKGK